MKLLKIGIFCLTLFLGIAGVLAGVLNRYGGGLSEDIDIIFYGVAVLSLLVATILGYLLIRGLER